MTPAATLASWPRFDRTAIDFSRTSRRKTFRARSQSGPPQSRFAGYGLFGAVAEKVFRVANDHALGILFEAFNLTNQANVLNVNAVAGDDFGTPIAYLPGREIQIGVRYLFGR